MQNLGSWEEARDYAKRRIKELKESLRIFEQKVKAGEPWPESQQSATRNKPATEIRPTLKIGNYNFESLFSFRLLA